jgi:serine protease Do
VLKYNGTAISRTSELLNYLNRSVPNQTIQLEILRDDKTRNISATLTTAPDDTPAKVDQDAENTGPKIGVAIRDLSPSELAQLNIKGGVLIQDVMRGGVASQARILPGDVITQLNNTSINNSKEFIKTVSGLKKDSIVRVSLIREGQRAILGMRI